MTSLKTRYPVVLKLASGLALLLVAGCAIVPAGPPPQGVAYVEPYYDYPPYAYTYWPRSTVYFGFHDGPGRYHHGRHHRGRW